MKAFKLTKKQIINILIITAISSVISVLSLKSLGIKDSAMLFIATASLAGGIFLAFNDKKKSLLLFIVSLPILVTARKAFYFDFLIFKVTYETLYISIIFILSFKDILKWCNNLYLGENKRKLNLILLVFTFVIFALNSSIFSFDIIRSIRYTFISVIVPVMFMLSVITNFKKHDLVEIFYALFIQISFSSLYGFVQIITSGKSFSDRSVLTFGYHNVNIFAGLVILIIPFMLERFFYGKIKIIERLLIGGAIVLNTAALYITFTRGALLAFIISVPVIFISRRYRWILYGGGLLSIVAAKPAFQYIVHRGTTTSLTSNESTLARIQSLFTSVKIFESLPFGVGAGNFAEFYKTFSIKGYLSMPEKFRTNILVASYNLEAAHNLWLQIAVELGIVTAVVFLVLIINRLIAAVRNFKDNRPAVGAILAYLVFSVLTGVEFEHKGVITITLVIWLIFGIIEINNRECSYDEKPN